MAAEETLEQENARLRKEIKHLQGLVSILTDGPRRYKVGRDGCARVNCRSIGAKFGDHVVATPKDGQIVVAKEGPSDG